MHNSPAVDAVTATLLALTAAVLHASWNLMAKRAPDPFLALWGQFVWSGVLAGVGLLVFGGPSASAWPWAVLGGIVHIPYVAGLAHAYNRGDFSLAYPVARGGGAMVAAVGGVALLDDELSLASASAIAVITAGMALLAWGADRAALTTALGVALTIGAYTVADARGARQPGGAYYALASFPCTAVAVTLYGTVRGRGRELVASWPMSWRRYVGTGTASFVTYGLVLIAVRRAPVGYVAALRESSVLLAAFAGWRYLDESRGRQRMAAAAVIVAGMGLLVLAR